MTLYYSANTNKKLSLIRIRHLCEQELMTKRISEHKSGGGRKMGRWPEDVEKDLQELEVKRRIQTGK
jgi:hypothetical protein